MHSDVNNIYNFSHRTLSAIRIVNILSDSAHTRRYLYLWLFPLLPLSTISTTSVVLLLFYLFLTFNNQFQNFLYIYSYVYVEPSFFPHIYYHTTVTVSILILP